MKFFAIVQSGIIGSLAVVWFGLAPAAIVAWLLFAFLLAACVWAAWQSWPMKFAEIISGALYGSLVLVLLELAPPVGVFWALMAFMLVVCLWLAWHWWRGHRAVRAARTSAHQGL